jgi:hypothetical protein
MLLSGYFLGRNDGQNRFSHPSQRAFEGPNYVLSTENDLPTPQFVELYRNACQAFTQHDEIAQLPNLLAARYLPVKRNELSYYLRVVHPVALDAIFSVLEAANLKPARAADDKFRNYAKRSLGLRQIIEGLNQVQHENIGSNSAAEALMSAGNSSAHQLNLIAEYNGSLEKRRLLALRIDGLPQPPC